MSYWSSRVKVIGFHVEILYVLIGWILCLLIRIAK